MSESNSSGEDQDQEGAGSSYPSVSRFWSRPSIAQPGESIAIDPTSATDMASDTLIVPGYVAPCHFSSHLLTLL